jgi:hypothetical protein
MLSVVHLLLFLPSVEVVILILGLVQILLYVLDLNLKLQHSFITSDLESEFMRLVFPIKEELMRVGKKPLARMTLVLFTLYLIQYISMKNINTCVGYEYIYKCK